MFLSLSTLTSIIRTGLPILLELIDLLGSVIIILSQMTLLRWLTFLCRSHTRILIVLLFWTYPRLDSFGILVFFTNLSLIEALFLLFSVIEGFKWFWMEILRKNIKLILEFLKASFLVQHFSCYTLMTFLMKLSVILLSMLMILFYSKYDQASNLWQQLQLASELESDLQDAAD